MPVEIVDDEFQYIKMIVGGMPGSGKTRWASTWPNVVYADAEGRLLSVRDRKPRRWRIRSTKDLLDLKRALEQSPAVRESEFGGPVETIVIDTLDEVARIVQRERLDATGHDTMQRDDWGAIKETLAQIIRGFRNLDDVHVIFNVHLTTREDEESGRSMVWPQIEGGMRTEVFNFVDIALLLTAKTRTDPNAAGGSGTKVLERRLQTLPDARHEWIKDHSGAIPDGFEINFNDDWDRLATAIFGSVPPVIRPSADIARELEAENLEKVKKVKEALDEAEPAPQEQGDEDSAEGAEKAEELHDDVNALRKRQRPSKTEKTEKTEKAKEPEATDEPAPEPAPEPDSESTESESEPESAPEPEPEPAPVSAEDDSTPEQASAEPKADAAAEPPVEKSQPEPSVDDEVAELKRKLAEVEAAKAQAEQAESPAKEASEDLQRRLDEAHAKAAANAEKREAQVPAGVDGGTGEVVDPEALAAEQAESEAAPEPSAEAEPDAVPEEGTGDAGTDPETGLHLCEVCDAVIENEDVAELSYIRYQQHLCPEHFAERKKAKGRK